MVAPRSGSTLDLGAQVGPYRITGELGSGGMGMVYRAAHLLLRRPAAIKVLRPELGNCVNAKERFLAEACAMAAIRHPGIVEVYDYGYTETGHAFIAMELLEGQTLGARLAERGRLGLFETMVLARRIAAALAAAHERGVVHRDLKPANVFLVRDHDGGSVDQVKLLDFGVAKLERAPASKLPVVELILGTPPYMSPEQCRGSSDCDHRTDLYALGCILFELLTGRPPYGSGLTSDELAAAQQRLPVPDVARHVALPPEIARLITRLLAIRLEDRPRNALEVVAVVNRWLATHGLAMPAPRGVRRLASMVASGIASSWAALGARYHRYRRYRRYGVRRSGLAATQRGSDTMAPTAVVRQRFMAGVADTWLTSAPTQPMAALEPSPPPTLIAGPRRRTPPSGLITPELGNACGDGIEPIEPFSSR
jgi:hypothetical protein